MSELHVIPDERTTWRVYQADAPVLLSEHTNATEAQFVAQGLAEARGAERSWSTIATTARTTPCRRFGPAGIGSAARARQLDAARERANQLAPLPRTR